jgi:SNF2 family DNA or RNA helicase
MAKDVLDLPEVMHEDRLCELGPEAWKWYEEVQEELSIYVSETERINTEIVLTKILRMQQITSGYLPVNNSYMKVDDSKASLLEDIVTDISQDEPVIVFCKFQHDLDEVKMLAEKLGRTYGEISGRIKSGLDDKAELKDGVMLCAVQMQAGGVGIDLSKAHYGIYYSVGYSLGDYEQSLARLHRPGQKNHVMFYHLIAGGTIDEVIYSSLKGKKGIVDEVLRSVKK